MEWIYLIIASVFEIGWPFGLKMASISSHKVLWIIFVQIALILSGVFLYFAQKQISIGTAYAIWTSIGAIGTFTVGVLVFNDAFNFMRALGIVFIIGGIVCLKLG